MAIELSDKLLLDAGGWREMKEARSIHSAGKVSDASYQEGWLEGTVLHSGKSLKVRMEITSRINMDNHCPCFQARRDGIICAHALAVGLEVLSPTEKKAASVSPVSPPGSEKKQALSALSPEWPQAVDIADSGTLPAQFHLILSPDLSSAWKKKGLLFGVEVEVNGDRKMLAALKGKKLFLDARDSAILRHLQGITPDRVPSALTLPGDEFLRLLGILCGHPRVMFGKNAAAEISYLPLRPGLELINEKIVARWPEGTLPLIGAERAWAMREKRFHPVALGMSPRFFSIFSSGLALDPAWVATFSSQLEQWFDLDDALIAELPRVVAPQIAVHFEGSLNHQEAQLFFVYGDSQVAASLRQPQFVAGGVSDSRAEACAIEDLESHGFRGAGSGKKGSWVLKDKKAILRFLARGFSRLDPAWIVSTGERFDHAFAQVDPVEATFDFRGSGENWFSMDLTFSTPSGEGISRAEIQRILQMGQESKTLPSGRIAVVDEDFIESIQQTVADVDPRQEKPGIYTIDRTQAGYLVETAAAAGIRMRGASPWDPDYAFADIDPALDLILRPYQRDGVKWMLGLAARSMGGILADDMGLGKTLQTLATIQVIGGSTLVICPSSLVFNWMAEAERFVPGLKKVAITGPDRDEIYLQNEDADIFITSYALLRLDSNKWGERGEFTTIILDEAQHIKNPESKVARAAHRLAATYRFALTGTPVENSVCDLWSITRFVLPRYLGTKESFVERFEKPINKGDRFAQARLSLRLRPVILRRLKSEVARDLPPKIEQVVYCELKPRQQAVYEQILRESRQSILDAEGNRKRMMALTALLRLRQACCDLRLLGLRDVEEADASAKIEALEELLSEAVEGGHRVLIFSQFVEMLQVLVPMLVREGWKFCYLDGSTRDRGAVVRQFQESTDIPVFLISLKAGGVGLNLTAADTVIHVDPWWNPAIEAQATDRAHRIGQVRIVTSYKLIARHTVEEKILALQLKKKETLSAILDGTADLGESGLADEELMDLIL